MLETYLIKRRDGPELFCLYFSVTESQRTDTTIVIINISCNTAICCDWLSSLRVRQTGERVVAWSTFDCLHFAWGMIEVDKWFSAISWPLGVGGSVKLCLWQLWVGPHHWPFLSPLSWFLCKIHFIQAVMGHLREPLILQRDFSLPPKWLQLFDADGCLGLIPDFWLVLH